MKFIYCMDDNITEDFKNMGLKVLGEVTINGKKVLVFANNPDVTLNVYQKKQILLTNRLFFDAKLEEE